jgi:arylsulfatase
MKGQKGSADEGGTRVPAYFRWDKKIGAGKTIDTIAAHIDIFPTIAALAGAELPPNQVDGRSLLPLLADENHNLPDRYLFTHCGRWPIGADPDNYKMSGFAVRNQRYRLVGYKKGRNPKSKPVTALYDMEQDPGQKTNIAAQHPETVQKMLKAYDIWWQGTRPLMVNENAVMSKTHPYYEHFLRQKENRGIPDWNPCNL